MKGQAILKENSKESLRSESDDVLVLAFIRGDREVYGLLVERYHQRIRNTIYSIFNDPALVEDLAQDVFIKAYEALPSFKFQSAFYTWLYRIAINRCRDEMRKRKVRKFFSLQSMMENSTDETVLELTTEIRSYEENELVNKALASIPERFRIPVVLKDIEGLQYSEIAQVLQTRIGTVKSRIARGRMMLKEYLAPYVKEYSKSF